MPRHDKCIICVAPHTSNWDFIIAKLYYWAIGRSAGFLMKKEWFVGPMGWLFRRMGGIPVERKRHTDLTDQLDTYEQEDLFAPAQPQVSARHEKLEQTMDNIRRRFGGRCG